jgi:uncharacterized protein YcbX
VNVAGLALTAVKGTRLRTVDAISLGFGGAHGDRAFFLVDASDRMVNGKTLGELNAVVASWSAPVLSLTLPGGDVVSGEVALGEPIEARFYSDTQSGRLVRGPWNSALSELIGQRLRLVLASGGGAIDRGADGAVSLISRASLSRLASEAGVPAVDARRFRMLIEVDGAGAHEEDSWVGRRARVGAALVEFAGHVGRCLITSRDPETGVIDLPTLEVIGAYRRELEATEPLPFGIYGSVVEPGTVRVGDACTVLPA